MNYIPLKAGDVRQEGDEYQVNIGVENGVTSPEFHPKPNRRTMWSRCLDLLGWPILASDTMHMEFRRPVK